MYIFSLLNPNVLIITGIIGPLAILLSYKKGYIRHVILFLLSMFVVLGLILLAFNPMASQHNASQKMSQFQNALPNNQWVIHVGHMNTNGKGEVDDNHSAHSINNGIIHASDGDNTGDANYHIDGSNIYLSNFNSVADSNDVATSSDDDGNAPIAKLDMNTVINNSVKSALNDHEKNSVYVFRVKNSDKLIVFTKA